MDINYYLHREQIERMRAARASTETARAAHRRMADLYRARIAAYREDGDQAVETLLVVTDA